MSGFTEMKTKKFAFFGCWNEVHYPSEDPKENDAPCFKIQENEPKHKCDEFSAVLEEIKTQNVDFLVVAGDNYYPQKKKDDNGNKTKTFGPEDFYKGFNALKSVDKPTYLLIGNHDVDNIAPKEKTKDKTKKDKSKKGGNLEGKDCRVIDAEIEFAKNKDSKIKIFDYKLELIVEEMQKTNTLCIMVDTNFEEPLDCYSSLLKEEDKHLNREQIIDKQKTMIKKIIDNYKNENQNPIQNVCFFGHHPLLCLKKKKGKVILEDDNMEWNHFLFHVIVDEKNGLQDIPHKYYFCADLHHYQTGVVTITDGNKTIKIKQYIAGTGGAHMDPKITEESRIEKEYLRKISIRGDIHSSYVMNQSIEKNGFLIIDYTIPELSVVFHPVYFSKKAKPLSHLPSLRSKSRSRSRGRSHSLSRRGKLGIIRSNSLGGKTRRIKRKNKKNKH